MPRLNSLHRDEGCQTIHRTRKTRRKITLVDRPLLCSHIESLVWVLGPELVGYPVLVNVAHDQPYRRQRCRWRCAKRESSINMRHRTTLDRSGGSVFRITLGLAKVALIRAARSTLMLDRSH